MFVASFAKKSYLTLKLTFDLELWQNKSRYQKRPLLKISHLVQVAFVPSGIIILQNAVGMSLTCPLTTTITRQIKQLIISFDVSHGFVTILTFSLFLPCNWRHFLEICLLSSKCSSESPEHFSS